MDKEELFVLNNKCGCKISVFKGELESPTGIDFLTRYLDPTASPRLRTPKHEHVFADVIAKGSVYPGAFEDLLSYFTQVLAMHKPAHRYPRAKDIGNVNTKLREKLVDSIQGKHLFHTEDLLQAYELIIWQEITRYPQGSLTRKILDLLKKQDLFAAVGLATLKRA